MNYFLVAILFDAYVLTYLDGVLGIHSPYVIKQFNSFFPYYISWIEPPDMIMLLQMPWFQLSSAPYCPIFFFGYYKFWHLSPRHA